jgi:hypothetical protein
MKRIRLLVLAFLGSLALRAQDESSRQSAPPPENLTFLTDEYIYIPKYKFSLGMRRLSGSKTSFASRGMIVSPSDSIGATTGTDVYRTYHDGTVYPDTRTVVVDDGNGSSSSVPIAPDGKTNTWTYLDTSQVTAAGNIAMNTYTAELTDTSSRTKNTDNSYGFEVLVARDMGKLASRFEWNLAAGLSLNDLKASLRSTVAAKITNTRDVYSLYGAPAPTAPYNGAGTATAQNVLDANGNPVLNNDGTNRTVTPDTITLLGNEPLSRTVTTTNDATSVTNSWKLKGAYYTFRAGPTVIWPVTQRLRATLSAGAALVYSGTTYSITQEFETPTGVPTTLNMSGSANHILPGYFADANVEFWLTDTAGFYAGAVYQSTGDFKQTVSTSLGEFTTKVDLSGLSGLRAGIDIKF